MARPYDIESGVVLTLSAATGKPWATRIPNPRPIEFGKVSRIGGVKPNQFMEAPLLLVEAWATDEVSAFDLCADAWHVFDRLSREGGYLGDAWVSVCSPASPISYYDSSTGLPRFQFTVNLTTTLKESIV